MYSFIHLYSLDLYFLNVYVVCRVLFKKIVFIFINAVIFEFFSDDVTTYRQHVQDRAYFYHDQARWRPEGSGWRDHQEVRTEGIQAGRHEADSGRP